MKITDFARRLNARMSDLKLTQADLVRLCQPYAVECGIKLTKKNISQYVNGQHIPRDKKLVAICKALDVDETYFVSGDDGSLILNESEVALIRCWRRASVTEKENIAFILRSYGIIPVHTEIEKNA